MPRNSNGVWPGHIPNGPVRNITPNGTVRDTGEQSPFGNGWRGRGTLGTGGTSGENLGDRPTNTNRTGEGQ